jgi:SAM-dependent MidA family methyltransferase
MELCLYAPRLGYYSAAAPKFGASGDFTTAPELGDVFARCLAHPCREILTRLGEADILEAGAGSGALAADLLLALAALGCPPRRYFILELSTALRAHQEETLKQKAPRLFDRVRWLERLPAPGFRGIVLGNELLDAMPVARFHVAEGEIRELCVGWEGNAFVWAQRPAASTIAARIAPLALPPGYTSEIGLYAEAWVQSLAERLAQGVVLLIDYGFPRAEFYHPERSRGTLMCHYKHRAHDDPLVFVGMQDITAHVDFTAIAEAGTVAGLELLGYTSQAAFLLEAELERIAGASDPDDARAHLALTQQIKKLTLPHEMGELFKVIALGRGIEEPLRGFSLQDRRHRL